MSHSDNHFMQSSRPAPRRRHRRVALSTVAQFDSRVDSAPFVTGAPTTVVGLAKTLVQEAGMFELLAAEARIAELERALAEVRVAAFADPLTGALNRRGFEKASERELARARRNGGQVALAHIDLDDFKRLNDTLGHHVGDKALIHLVSLLQKSMRPTDVLCRFGGEEFVLMLPDTRLEDAAAVVARFQSEFSAQAIPGTEHVMTFSAGVVAHAIGEPINEAIHRADVATYAAKRAGKNRVVAC